MMKKFLLILLILTLLLAGCDLLAAPNTQTASASDASIFAMNTQMDLRLYGDRDGAVMGNLTALLNRLDRSLSATSADSALTALNESGRSEDAELAYLTGEALSWSKQTGGALDVTLLPVSRLWGFTTGVYRVPAASELEALRGIVGMDQIRLTDGAVSLAEGTMLDFGALAKGYAADLCRAELEKAGLSGILSLGGNIQTVGTKPDGSDWFIGVQAPDDPGRYILTLRLRGSQAVVTSGDYQRNFTEDGVLYCHIMNPETLSPVRGSLRAVTVVTDQGLKADALSTALYVLGRETGAELWRNLGGFEAIWLEADGSIWLTPGLKDLAEGAEFEVLEP